MAEPAEKTGKLAGKDAAIVCLVIALIISLIANLVSYTETHQIGDLEKRKDDSGQYINIVYVGASSKIYASYDSTNCIGTYIELLSLEEIAETIDRNGFPAPVQYWAETPDKGRYLVKLQLDGDSSSKEYWIELPDIEETLPETTS